MWFVAEALDEVADLDDLLRVEADGGLVQNENRRVAEQSLRNADTLLVALRQVADETSVDVVNLRQTADLADMLLAVELDALQLIHEVEVLFDRHIHVKRRQLRQVADELFTSFGFSRVFLPCTVTEPLVAERYPVMIFHGCGFTCTVRPEEADDGALFNREADIVQRGICTVALREVLTSIMFDDHPFSAGRKYVPGKFPCKVLPNGARAAARRSKRF